jgi:hypothetical protein
MKNNLIITYPGITPYFILGIRMMWHDAQETSG